MVKTANFIRGGDGLVAKSCPTLVSPWEVATQVPLSMDSPGRNTGVGCHFLLQGIFLTQGLNPHPPALAGGFFTTEPPGKPRCCVLSCLRLSVTPWTEAHQGPLSMEFSRQEYWSGLPFPSPGIQVGIIPPQGSNSCLLCLLHWQVDFFFSTETPGKSFM